jgi:hypothetical protein
MTRPPGGFTAVRLDSSGSFSLKRRDHSGHHLVTMLIEASERFACRHELVGLRGFFRCAKCPFQVSELPLSKKSGGGIVNATFGGADASPERVSKTA